MNRFDKINESVNSTSRKYSLNLKDDQENNGDIEINNVSNKKQAKGTFSVKDDILKITIIESNYSENYLKNIIINDLLDSNIAVNNIEINFYIPEVGSIIATRLHLDKNIGDEVNLKRKEYYHAVNSDFINCNGWELKKSFRARLERKEDKRCEGINLSALTYTFFKLISEI